MTISVALADDQALVRMGLRVLVESEDDLVLAGEAEDGRQAVELVRRTRPDVILMDIRMPQLDGIAALRMIVADPSLAAVRVIMLTTFELDEYVFEALQAGAAGFLIKDTEPADMLRCHPARRGRGVAVVAVGHAPSDRIVRVALTDPQEASATGGADRSRARGAGADRRRAEQ